MKPSAPEGGARTRHQLALYRLGLTVLGATFRVGPLASILARVSKVFLRHARIRHLLRTGGFDSIVDGGAAVGEFAFAARDFAEAGTLNELEEGGLPIEADKLFVRRVGGSEAS